MNITVNNPLLDFSGLPRFAEIKPEHVSPAIEKLLAECRELVAYLLARAEAPGWQNFVAPLEDAHERLSRAWGPVGHLNAVMNSPELREAYNSTLPVITQYYAELGQNLELFNKFKMLRHSPEFGCLSATRKKVIENELRDFRLGGAELPENKKERYLQVQERLTSQIKEAIQNTLNPLGVAVVIEARHLCMSMRGVQKQSSVTTTSDFTGAFNRAETRAEFISLLSSKLS